MRRLLRSFFGGFSATVFLLTLLFSLDDAPALQNVLRVVIFWPLLLWERLFPPSCCVCLPPLRGFVLTLTYNLLFYSFLTWAVLRLAGRRNLRTS